MFKKYELTKNNKEITSVYSINLNKIIEQQDKTQEFQC